MFAAFALYNEVTFDGQLDNAVELKSEYFDDHGVHMIDAITSAIVGGAINDDIMDVLDDACDHCRAEPPTLSSVQNLLIFPDISADQGNVRGRTRCPFVVIDVIIGAP